MINIQNELRSQKYDYSIKSWKKWCEKNNYELFILEERIYGKDVMNPNWHKMFVFDL